MISPFEQLIDNRTESSIDNPFLATTTSPLSAPIAQSINPSTSCLPTTFLRLPLPLSTSPFLVPFISVIPIPGAISLSQFHSLYVSQCFAYPRHWLVSSTKNRSSCVQSRSR